MKKIIVKELSQINGGGIVYGSNGKIDALRTMTSTISDAWNGFWDSFNGEPVDNIGAGTPNQA